MKNTQRNNGIAQEYIRGSTLEQISSEYGISPRMIRYILTQKGLRAEDRKKQPSFDLAPSPRSQLHLKIGQRLYEAYFVKRGLSRAEAAVKMGISAKGLRNLESGRSNIDLLTLQNIAGFMEISVGELIDGS